MSEGSQVTEKRTSGRSLGWAVFFAEFFLCCGMATYFYANYIMTDIIHLPVDQVSGIMAVGSIVAVVLIFIEGFLVTNTRTKFGQYRPWIVGSYFVLVAAIFILMFLDGDSMLVVALCFVLYSLAAFAAVAPASPKYTLFANISGSDNDLRNLLNARMWGGNSVSNFIVSAILFPMIALLSIGGSEIWGWRITQIIMIVATTIGVIIICKISAPYDQCSAANGAPEVEEEHVSAGEMIKAVVTNRPALAITLADFFRYAGVNVFSLLTIYQCAYVIGDMVLTSTVMAAYSLATIIGSFASTGITKLFGGRKRMSIIVSLIAGVAFVLVGFFGQSSVWLIALIAIAGFFNSPIDSVGVVMYMDAGEYWIAKTGKDTRPFIMNMQPLVIQAATAVASVIMGVALTTSGFIAGEALTAAGAQTLTMWLGMATGAGFILFALCLILIHNISDKKMEEYMRLNAENGLTLE
ncbi:MFS transporter [Adlercreutzia shanghongiae]|uniref:MFS transporter n=1 Tax=Adlercreutzia shanghongiae TaxID=3111773 RepID=A0ABU6IYX3_9ACTN|nr:MFS transporter [Adlercreutzia sp. R22]MEC4294875.1 MFS transporter [Adlercreutzia sp. R22]